MSVPVGMWTQTEAILAHFQRGGRLTAMEALRLYGCARLAARVHELRGRGYDIRSRLVKLPNGKVVAEYWLNDASGSR